MQVQAESTVHADGLVAVSKRLESLSQDVEDTRDLLAELQGAVPKSCHNCAITCGSAVGNTQQASSQVSFRAGCLLPLHNTQKQKTLSRTLLECKRVLHLYQKSGPFIHESRGEIWEVSMIGLAVLSPNLTNLQERP